MRLSGSIPTSKKALSRRSETKNGHDVGILGCCVFEGGDAIVSILYGAGERENKTLNVVVVNVAACVFARALALLRAVLSIKPIERVE